MKTNLSFRIFNFYTLVPLGIAIAAAVIPSPVSAVAINNALDITENSPTSLSVTYNGSTSGVTVTLVTTDRWNVILPVTATAPGAGQWIEPENSNLVNVVQETATRFQRRDSLPHSHAHSR